MKTNERSKSTRQHRCHQACENSSATKLFLTLLASLPTFLPAAAEPPRWETTNDFNLARDISYVPGSSDRSQMLDLYLPRGNSKPVPLIVWIHGGGWSSGDKANPPTLQLLRDGFAIASINYRLSQQAKWPAQIYDCKAAIRWLRAHADRFHIDPKHFGVWGASAGGHLAALLGTTSDTKVLDGDIGITGEISAVQAVSDWCGPTDFMPRDKEIDVSPSARNVIYQLLGGPILQHREAAKAASPVNYIHGSEPPFLIMHGGRDSLVPVSQALELAKKLKTKKDPVELVIIPEAGHDFFSKETHQKVRDFFAKNLRK